MSSSQAPMHSNVSEASNGEGQRGLYGQLESFRQADAARDELLRVSRLRLKARAATRANLS